MARKIIRTKPAKTKIGVGNTKFYELKKNDPTFPKPVILGKHARGYFDDELDSWLESRREGGRE